MKPQMSKRWNRNSMSLMIIAALIASGTGSGCMADGEEMLALDGIEQEITNNSLNGLRVQVPGDPAIYLMDEGKKRHIPNPTTYNNLFRDWNGIYQDIMIASIDTGTAISHGAVLARANGAPEVYLIDQGTKRHIASPEVMDRYHFDWGKIQLLTPSVIASIPTGPTILWPECGPGYQDNDGNGTCEADCATATAGDGYQGECPGCGTDYSSWATANANAITACNSSGCTAGCSSSTAAWDDCYFDNSIFGYVCISWCGPEPALVCVGSGTCDDSSGTAQCI